MNASLAQNNELSKLNCEKQGLCDIVTKYLGALKGGRQMSSLFPKRNGVPVMETLRVLCMAKMLGDSLLKAYRQGFYGAGDSKRGKNSFYLFRSNPKINWREVMARMALRLKSFIIKNNMAETKAPHCFIIDDTAIVKTGLKMERASKIHDHTDGQYKLGYKLLACAYFDGKSTICPDFALLRESKRNNYGLSDEQLEKQHSKERDVKCPAHQRLSETDASKLSVAPDMVKRLWAKGLRAEYVLTDSWFSCVKFIKEVRAACDGKAHLVCRAKFNATKYDYNGENQKSPSPNQKVQKQSPEGGTANSSAEPMLWAVGDSLWEAMRTSTSSRGQTRVQAEYLVEVLDAVGGDGVRLVDVAVEDGG